MTRYVPGSIISGIYKWLEATTKDVQTKVMDAVTYDRRVEELELREELLAEGSIDEVGEAVWYLAIYGLHHEGMLRIDTDDGDAGPFHWLTRTPKGDEWWDRVDDPTGPVRSEPAPAPSAPLHAQPHATTGQIPFVVPGGVTPPEDD